MKSKARKIFSSLGYYAEKYGYPEISISYRNGHRTDYTINCRVEANLNRDVLIDMFGVQTKQVGEDMYESKDVYEGSNVSAKSHRKNGIDCLVSDGKYVKVFRTPNDTKRYGFTDVSVNYTRKQTQHKDK